jgi:hypothetical protein
MTIIIIIIIINCNWVDTRWQWLFLTTRIHVVSRNDVWSIKRETYAISCMNDPVLLSSFLTKQNK